MKYPVEGERDKGSPLSFSSLIMCFRTCANSPCEFYFIGASMWHCVHVLEGVGVIDSCLYYPLLSPSYLHYHPACAVVFNDTFCYDLASSSVRESQLFSNFSSVGCKNFKLNIKVNQVKFLKREYGVSSSCFYWFNLLRWTFKNFIYSCWPWAPSATH